MSTTYGVYILCGKVLGYALCLDFFFFSRSTFAGFNLLISTLFYTGELDLSDEIEASV